MPLEIANTIAQLDEQWPNGSDSVDRGDDHIRMIKNVLKKTFPGPNGQGFSIPLTVDPDLLNKLSDKLDALNKRLDNQYRIGDICFRIDNVNPGTIYGGTWSMLQADACFYFGNGNNGGTQEGSNTPAVPLPSHSHAASIASAGSHKHGYELSRAFDEDRNSGDYIGAGQARVVRDGSRCISPAGDHTHQITVNDTGVVNPTIDVRGARYYFNVWKRIS